MRTESGAWIPASYKSNRYESWKKKSKIEVGCEEKDERTNGTSSSSQQARLKPLAHKARHNLKFKAKTQEKSELKRPEQVMRARKIQEKKRNNHNKKGGAKKKPRNNNFSRNKRR